MLPNDGVALARILAVGVKVELGVVGAVEAVVGGGQEARGDQGGAAQEGLGGRGVSGLTGSDRPRVREVMMSCILAVLLDQRYN